MFSEKDFQKYFEEMETVEGKMIDLSSIIDKVLHDPESKQMIEEIHKDEIRHKKLVEQMASECASIK